MPEWCGDDHFTAVKLGITPFGDAFVHGNHSQKEETELLPSLLFIIAATTIGFCGGYFTRMTILVVLMVLFFWNTRFCSKSTVSIPRFIPLNVHIE